MARAYVRCDGDALGYVDLVTFHLHLESTAFPPPAVWDAVMTWAVQQRIGAPSAPSSVSYAGTGGQAGTRAGGSASQQAGPWWRRAGGSNSWAIGAAGERRTAKTLKNLPDPWLVLHAVSVGHHGADIDHVLVGPAGIVTVNTKSHPGRWVSVSASGITVDGERTDYVSKSLIEQQRVARLAGAAGFPDVPIRSLIVIDRARVTVQAFCGIAVLTRSTVCAHVAMLGSPVGRNRVQDLTTAVTDQRFWQPTTIAR